MRPRTTRPALFILILLLSLCAATACQDSHTHAPLWKVSSKHSTVYLLGSIHMLKPSDYPLNESLYRAFDSSSTVVFELDIAESTSEAAQGLIIDYSIFRDASTLKGALSPETYAMLDEALSKRGLDMKNAAKLKPWAMGTMMTVMELQRLKFMPAYGVDRHFYTKSLAEGKNIMALETLQYQLGVFNSMSGEDQEAFVLHSLREIEDMENAFPRMVRAWKTGDTRELQKLLEPCKDFRRVCETIIFQRNHDWLPKVEELLKAEGTTSILIAGAAHMVGENSLVALLKKKGYRVEQL